MSREDLLHRVRVAARQPFSLPLTVTVLRRTAGNFVDKLDEAGVYSRAFADESGAWVVEAAPAAEGFDLAVYGRESGPGAEHWGRLAGTILGADVDLAGFYAAAARVPGLDRLAAEMAGVKPPRYPDLWEALVNGIVFQQVSIHAATSIMRRIVERFGRPLDFAGAPYYPFPPPSAIVPAQADDLRAAGCSAAKVRALQGTARRILEGDLDLDSLALLRNEEVIARLTELPGIGPWTATVVLLRGLGRLDVFPPSDSGAARSLRGLFGFDQDDFESGTARVLEALGPYKGMLYYHLLLWRLATSGQGERGRGQRAEGRRRQTRGQGPGRRGRGRCVMRDA